MRRIPSWIAIPRYHSNCFANVPNVRYHTWRTHWLSFISSASPAIPPDNCSNTIPLPTNHRSITPYYPTQYDHRQYTWRFHFRYHHYHFNHSPSSARRICTNNSTASSRQTIMGLAACFHQLIDVLQFIYLARALCQFNRSRTKHFTRHVN